MDTTFNTPETSPFKPWMTDGLLCSNWAVCLGMPEYFTKLLESLSDTWREAYELITDALGNAPDEGLREAFKRNMMGVVGAVASDEMEEALASFKRTILDKKEFQFAIA